MIVYKYLDINRIDVLRDSRIRFTQPDALNDIFETNPSETHFVISRQIRQARGLTVGLESLGAGGASDIADAMAADNEEQGAFQRRKFINDTNAYLSLSHKRDNPLMWSHYSDSHKGFVIGFDTDNSFFKAGNGRRADLRNVIYSRNRPQIPSDGLDQLNDADFEKAIIEIMFTKSKDWAYEKEARLHAYPQAADFPPTEKDSYGFDICLYKFPQECVRQIIFGYRMGATIRKEVLQFAQHYLDAKFFEAVPDDLKYKMRIIQYVTS